METIKPPKLEKGDTIGIVSISAPLPQPNSFKKDIQMLKELGFKVKMGKFVYGFNKNIMQAVDERTDDFHKMIKDKDVKAIIFSCGGAHAINLIDKIDYQLIQKNPKIIVGFSDNTFLLVPIYNKTGLVTFYGPVAWYCVSHMTDFTFKNFKKIIGSAKPLGELKTDRKFEILKQGKAKGTLIGGNFSAVQALLGTPFEPDWHGKILYWEDLNTPTALISEILNHFRLAGVFDNIAGMIIGALPGCQKADKKEHLSLRGIIGLKNIILQQTRDYNFPIVYNFSFGHGVKNYFTLPNGIKASINTEKKFISIDESAVK